MPILVDSHADLAYNMLRYERDYTRSAAHIRALEKDNPQAENTLAETENAILGWEDYQRGKIGLLFTTLFALPARWNHSSNFKQVYKTYDEARRICSEQMDAYQRLTDSAPEKFRLVTTRAQLDEILRHWESDAPHHPVGMIPLMEGADGIRSLNELDEWHERGLRLIGPAWVGTRYSGGWREPGALTPDGRNLLAAMAERGFLLDISHMDEAATREALDTYSGAVVATHGNCLALLPNINSNRHFSDRVLEALIKRNGVVGIVPFNSYLKPGWTRANNRREEVPLEAVANHIDHVCQLAGDALHVGIGSDFDGGFGLESIPQGMDTIADLRQLTPLLGARGYSQTDIENILGGNWLARMQQELP